MLVNKLNELSEYSIYRKQHIAEKMSDDIWQQHSYIQHAWKKQHLKAFIEQELDLCPACYLVGANWQQIMRRCLNYLHHKPNNQHANGIKLRLLIRCTYPLELQNIAVQ